MAAPMYDLVVRGGLMADGSGGEPVVADVAVIGELVTSYESAHALAHFFASPSIIVDHARMHPGSLRPPPASSRAPLAPRQRTSTHKLSADM